MVDRTDATYDELKRQVECATFTEFSRIPSVAVRFPLVIEYVKSKTGKEPIFHEDGDIGTYNGSQFFCLSGNKSREWGYEFTDLNEWFYKLIDGYIEKAVMS